MLLLFHSGCFQPKFYHQGFNDIFWNKILIQFLHLSNLIQTLKISSNTSEFISLLESLPWTMISIQSCFCSYILLYSLHSRLRSLSTPLFKIGLLSFKLIIILDHLLNLIALSSKSNMTWVILPISRSVIIYFLQYI